MIIGLTGKRGVGKDVVGAYLVKNHAFERKSFADPLKHSVATLFDIPFEDIDRMKLDGTTYIGIGNATSSDDLELSNPRKMLSFREFLQRYSTEAHRDSFDLDFWVNVSLPLNGFYSGRAIVVTDVRFANEAERISELGGHVIKIVRPDLDDKDHHRSETEQEEIEPDYVIKNEGTIEELYSNVESILTQAGYNGLNA